MYLVCWGGTAWLDVEVWAVLETWRFAGLRCGGCGGVGVWGCGGVDDTALAAISGCQANSL